MMSEILAMVGFVVAGVVAVIATATVVLWDKQESEDAD